MNFFNFRSGRHGDTPDKMEELTALGADDKFYTLSAAETVARDAAACVLEGGSDYLIGGRIHARKTPSVTAPAPDLRL